MKSKLLDEVSRIVLGLFTTRLDELTKGTKTVIVFFILFWRATTATLYASNNHHHALAWGTNALSWKIVDMFGLADRGSFRSVFVVLQREEIGWLAPKHLASTKEPIKRQWSSCIRKSRAQNRILVWIKLKVTFTNPNMTTYETNYSRP